MSCIYHYCSLDVFHLIIKNKSIRLSDISKTNDSQEKVWIKKCVRNGLENAFDEFYFSKLSLRTELYKLFEEEIE